MFKTLASGLYKLGEQAVTAATAAIDRLANKQELEAVVAAAVLVASADGVIDPTEKAAALAATISHPALKSFEASDIEKLFKENVELLGMDPISAKATMYDKVRRVTDSAARTRIIGIATNIANADGKLEPSEVAVIDKLRGV